MIKQIAISLIVSMVIAPAAIFLAPYVFHDPLLISVGIAHNRIATCLNTSKKLEEVRPCLAAFERSPFPKSEK